MHITKHRLIYRSHVHLQKVYNGIHQQDEIGPQGRILNLKRGISYKYNSEKKKNHQMKI